MRRLGQVSKNKRLCVLHLIVYQTNRYLVLRVSHCQGSELAELDFCSLYRLGYKTKTKVSTSTCNLVKIYTSHIIKSRQKWFKLTVLHLFVYQALLVQIEHYTLLSPHEM